MTGVADASGQHVAVQAGHVHVEDGEVERLCLEYVEHPEHPLRLPSRCELRPFEG